MSTNTYYSGSGATGGSGHETASATTSYHNGGVEGGSFANWYDANLANEINSLQDDGSGSGGTKGSGSGGTKGSGSGGTKGSGTGGTKGSGTGGTKGSGSGGTKGSGSGGTKGSGSGGTKGSGSGGTKGSGSGGTKGSGTGGTKGSGSGGTKGSGSGGTKGSGSGGTKGSGSGGTKGSGNEGDDKITQSFEFGDQQKVTVSVTETPQGQIFVSVQATSLDYGEADIDGLLFSMADNSALDGLNFFPDPLALPVTGFNAGADAINGLPDGTFAPGTFDGAVQFGQSAGTTDGSVNTANFTLWSDNGPLTLGDLDLSKLTVVITSADGSTEILSDGIPLDQADGDEQGGSGGTKGSGSGGTKGSGSGGTKGSGSGGTKGSGTGGTKGSGSGGTKGSGTGGTKGSGTGGTKGSGTGGTKGSGTGGTKGSGSGGTTGGYSQWSGADASAAAGTLPDFEAHPEDVGMSDEVSIDDVLSLMTNEEDGNEQDQNWGTATAGSFDMDIF